MNNDKAERDRILRQMERDPRAWTSNKALNVSEVRVIVQLREEGLTQAAIADRFNVSAGTVSDILNGRTWQKVTGIQLKPRKPRKPKFVPPSSAQKEQIKLDSEMLNSDGTKRYRHKDIAEKYGFSVRLVRQIIQGRF